MVRLHAAMESVVFPRTTRDLDLGVDVRGHTREAMKKMATTLLGMGFSIETSIDGVARFRKEDIAIDLLAPEEWARRESVLLGRLMQFRRQVLVRHLIA